MYDDGESYVGIVFVVCVSGDSRQRAIRRSRCGHPASPAGTRAAVWRCAKGVGKINQVYRYYSTWRRP